MDTAYGASIFSYARVADGVRAISANVSHDILELFARMILNILVHNTDDHLKNTGFLMESASPGFRYRLAPLFDVVTQEGSHRHMLHLGPGSKGEKSGREGSLRNAKLGAAQWGLKAHAAETIIDRVQSVLARRHHYYRDADMDAREIQQVERWLSPEIAKPADQA